MDIKCISGEGSYRKEESCRERLYHLREYIEHHENYVARSVSAKGAAAEVADGN